METLINRIRHMLTFGLEKDEICQQLAGFPKEDVYLAYHAAKMLNEDHAKSVLDLIEDRT